MTKGLNLTFTVPAENQKIGGGWVGGGSRRSAGGGAGLGDEGALNPGQDRPRRRRSSRPPAPRDTAVKGW